MKLLGKTEHLAVYITGEFVISDEFCVPRRQVLAYPLNSETVHCPMLAVNMLLGEYPHANPLVDWMEATSLYRRHGLAREVFEMVKEHFPNMRAFGGTIEGEAFCSAMGFGE